MFEESVKCVFQENFKQNVKVVSRMFWFAILFLHGSHRSYPSRRRACFEVVWNLAFFDEPASYLLAMCSYYAKNVKISCYRASNPSHLYLY